jgi:hypothetical protein
VGIQVLTTARIKMSAFWDKLPRNLAEGARRLRGSYCLHNQGDDGGSKHLLNLNSVNQLIVVMVKYGVLFEVRTEFLNSI